MTSKYYRLAEFMHDVYETEAKRVGWGTQKKCRVPFRNLPDENKEVMIAVAEQVYGYMEKRAEVYIE